MASGILSRFGYMIQQGAVGRVQSLIADYPTLVSSSVTVTGDRCKVLGTVLHISKLKKVSYSGKVGDKKMKREVAYFRMVFCREDGSGGDVFCVLFELADKNNFMLSKFVIGGGITVINPVMEGDWAGINILRSASPCISGPANNSPHVPVPFPNTGFVAFGFSGVSALVIDVGFVTTCSGNMCHGLYGLKSCPCVTTSEMPKTALTIRVTLKDCTDQTILCEQLGLKLEPFVSIPLTELLVGSMQLEPFVKNNNQDQLFDLFEHVEKQVAAVTWSILGWWKATSVEDAALMVPKGHIVSMIPTGPRPIAKYRPTDEE